MSQLAIHSSKDGEYYLTNKGVLLSSKYSPKKEAYRVIEPFLNQDQDLVVLLGAGNASLIKEIQQKLNYNYFLIIENNQEIIDILNHPPISVIWGKKDTVISTLD